MCYCICELKSFSLLVAGTVPLRSDAYIWFFAHFHIFLIKTINKTYNKNNNKRVRFHLLGRGHAYMHNLKTQSWP